VPTPSLTHSLLLRQPSQSVLDRKAISELKVLIDTVRTSG
jgi:hypothetical protein